MNTTTKGRHIAPRRTLADRMQAARYARRLEDMAKTASGEHKADLLRAAREMRTGCGA